MNETTTPNDRMKSLIIVLTLINTLLSAIVAGLQADASIRTETANRDSEYYSILSSAELLRASVENEFEMTTFGQVLENAQRSLIQQYTQLQFEQSGEGDASSMAAAQSAADQARADQATLFSSMLTDPRYAPSGDSQMPDWEAYLADSYKDANDLVAMQNEASDLYHIWNAKSDAYVAILTILAIAFFLLGLAQASNGRIRFMFTLFGFLAMTFSSLWVFITLVG
jgi:hypothetical protein